MFLILGILVFGSCDKTKKDEKSASNQQLQFIVDDENKLPQVSLFMLKNVLNQKKECCNADTSFLMGTDWFYVKHVWENDTFQIHFGVNNFDTCFPFKYTCNSVKSAIPKFSWSSRDVISFSRGCGAACWINCYFVFTEKKMIEREYVLETDSVSKIVYSKVIGEDVFIVLEDVISNFKRQWMLEKLCNLANVNGSGNGFVENIDILKDKILVKYWTINETSETLHSKTFNY